MTQEQLLKKKLKAEYKQNQNERKLSFEQLKKERTESQKSITRILTGLVENEKLLSDDYPVNMKYLYVMEQEPGDFKVIVSPISGDVKRLKVYSKAINIYSCNLVNRNILC